jgi:hypothetical protein
MRLAQAVDLAERFDREGGGRPGDLAAYLSRATVESPRHAGVRVMTIHRAKGLEFDVVVMPALDRPLLRPPHAPVYLLRRSPLAPVEAVHRTVAASVRRLARELEDGHRQEAARRLRDDLSVLYVGLTRARQALHLWVEPRPSSTGAADSARDGLSFAGILRSTLVRRSGGEFEAAAGDADRDGVSDGVEVDCGDGATILYRCGDRAAVARSIASARLASGSERQQRLPLLDGRHRELRGALRPAIALDELSVGAETSASAILALAGADDTTRGSEWNEVEAAMASRGEGAAERPAIVQARRWLFAGGARLEQLHRRRRIAVSVGGRVGAGELERLWIASDGSGKRRAVVGVRDRAAGDRGLQIERLAAARSLGLPGEAVAVLVLGPEPLLVTAAEKSG